MQIHQHANVKRKNNKYIAFFNIFFFSQTQTENGTRPKYFCDFESEDICGWDHDVNHDFDWRRFRYSTPSGHVGTGPSFDHTKGEGKDGYYMYLESSSRFENDTARLISPFFDKTENNTCFEFYYHMYGATMGTLRVYLKKANDTWDFDGSLAFFEKSGNQGDQWFRSLTSLGAVDQDFQVINYNTHYYKTSYKKRNFSLDHNRRCTRFELCKRYCNR